MDKQVCPLVCCKQTEAMSQADNGSCIGTDVSTDSKMASGPTGDARRFPEKPSEGPAFYAGGISLKPAEEYKMDHQRRGLVLLFNHEHFSWELNLNSRFGTNSDRYNLEKRFESLNFEVRAYDNLKREDVLAKISEAAQSNHADADCFLCVFMSHGENDFVYASDGKVSIADLTGPFKGNVCRSLVGKPKIFILQACRGDQHDLAVTPMDVVDSEAKVNEVVVDAAAVHTLPAGADFLMCYSVAEGYYSHRETINGSWYIQDLCAALQHFGGGLEVTELLTLVNRMVSLRSVGNSSDRNAIGKKQVPCYVSMLTKKLYFRTNQ